MSSFRVASRLSRTIRVPPALRQFRHESTRSSSSTSGGSFSPSLIGGLAGGGLVFLGCYGWYHFSGAKTLVNTAHQAKATFSSYSKQFESSTPDFEPNQAIEWLRSTAKSYAAIIPGASGYIDSAFNDIDAIRNKHSKEVDGIIKEAYNELKDVSQEGVSVTTAQKSQQILQKHLKRIGDLAGDAAQDIINHSQMKEKVGENLDQLKEMGDKYGPEAKKQVDETWDQIRDVMKTDVSATTIPKVQKLVQDRVQKVQELGGKVWDHGMEKAKPFLEKSPEVKEVVEGYLKMVPGGSEILPKLSEMQKYTHDHGEEAEKLANDTFKEIEQVLQKKVGEAKDLAQKAKKDAKSD